MLNDTVEKEGTYIVTEDEETGNKFLRITSGKGTGSRIYADYDFTKGGTQPGMSESFVFEASVRFSKVGTEFGMGQMTGKLFSDQYRVNPASVGNPSMFIQHYPTPESASTKAEYLIMGINSQKFYNLRFVYSRRTEENRFVIDAYRDDRDGQGYKLINENIRLAKETEKLSDLINTIKIYTINDKPNEEQNAVIDFDNIKIYPYNPPEIVSSSIKDLESGISVDTRDMTFVFNSDINNAVVKPELTDNLTGEKTVLNSEYHADLKSLIVEIPQGALSQNGDYTISLSDVFGIDGMKLEGKNSIRFTTSSSFSPIELSGPITFSAEQGGESLASIYNVSSVFANIPVRKLIAEDVSAVAAVALYDGNGALRKVNFENVLVTEDTVISSAGVEYDNIPYNWYAKAFVWDSLENMAPMLPTGYIKAGVELTVSDMFSDNMVLQRGEKIPVWGTGYDAEAVEVSIKDGDEIIAQTEVYPVNSRWKAELPALEAGGPYELTITNGEDTKTFENVSMGDVWLVSGQSNMVKTMNDGLYIKDTQTDINNADYPDIRFYKVGELSSAVKADSAGSSWEVCNPATAAKFSCVGFYFGRGIYESLEEGVPVGLIQSAVAGTKIERWISEEGMENYNVTNPVNLSSTLYNGMIAPLQNYNIKGVLWYQGESNYDNAEYYENNLAALIKSWRDEWNKPDMPFIYVQLPPYGQYNFAPIWNAQLNVLKKIENTAMVPAVDLGELSNIHPAQKDKVGKRAADAAQAVAYGRNIEYMGPLFESAELVNGRVEISFSHAAGLYSETEEIKGFKVGNESVEEDASARIEGNKIILEFDGVFNPEYVSYCYVNEGGVTLFNSAGLPASPFKAEI